LAMTPRQMRRIRRAIERQGISAVMDQRVGGHGVSALRRRRSASCAGSSPNFTRTSRIRHFYEHLSEKHGVAVSYTFTRVGVAGSGNHGEGAGARPVAAPARARRPMVGIPIHLDRRGCRRWTCRWPHPLCRMLCSGGHTFDLSKRWVTYCGATVASASCTPTGAPISPHRQSWPSTG
jgi:hypothetical protein